MEKGIGSGAVNGSCICMSHIFYSTFDFKPLIMLNAATSIVVLICMSARLHYTPELHRFLSFF